jgi:hypothetical protein
MVRQHERREKMNHVVIVTFSTAPALQIRYLGPYQIAWYIRQHGFNSQVLDFLFFMSKEQRMSLYKKYISEETKIIGFAPFIARLQEKPESKQKTLGILQEIKENFPWAKIVIGGPFAVAFRDSVHKQIDFKIDAVFIGQGEYTFLEYCNYIFNNGPHPNFNLINDIKVVNYTKEYNIFSCKMRFEEQDFILENEALPLQLSRGCIFKCKFCRYELIGKNKDDFNRSLDIIKETMIYHYENFGVTRYNMADDTFNSHRERTKKFHEMIKTLPFKIEYVGYLRIDLLDIWPEQQDILVDSGLVSCHFGIESLDPISCKQIGKGWGAKNNKKFLKHLLEKWKNNVIIRCSLIAGLGKETEKDWESTNKWFLDSGVHNWDFKPLGINIQQPMTEFELSPAKFGFRWPDLENNPFQWENDYTDFVSAGKWCEETNFRNQKKQIPGAWHYSFHRTLNFSREQISSSNLTTLKEIVQTEKRIQKLVDTYYQKAITYKA